MYKMQMPSGILIFGVEISAIELNKEGDLCSPSEIKSELNKWWESPNCLRRSPEEACLGVWATITDFFVNTRQHNRVKCTKVSVLTSGQETSFTPTQDTWSQING